MPAHHGANGVHPCPAGTARAAARLDDELYFSTGDAWATEGSDHG